MKKLSLAVIVLVILLGGLYLERHQIKSMMGGTSATPTPTMSSQMSPTPSMAANAVFMSMSDKTKGNYMTDEKGMTLYTYDKDTTGVSNCYNGCAKAWPPYTTANQPTTLPTDVTVIKRTDGTMQFAYKGMPLYYYETDSKAGDITGDGVGNVWHIIKL